MAELQDTDKFLVNRSNNTRQLSTDKLMAELRDDDLMLVNRAGVSYKATGAEIKDSLKPDEEAPDINAVALTEIKNDYRYTDKEFPYTVDMAADGNPPPTYAVKAKLSGTTFNFAVESDTITKVEGGGANVYTTDTIAAVINVPQPDYTTVVSKNGNGYGVEIEPMFNGNVNQAGYFRYTPANGLNIVPGTIVVKSKLRLKYKTQGSAGYLRLNNINTSTEANNPSNPSGIWVDVDLSKYTLPLDITRIATSGGNANDTYYLYAWEVDDVILASGDPGLDNVLTFPTSNNFDKFEVGDVVQGPYVITDIDEAGPTITTDGGSWAGADGTGDSTSDGRYEPAEVWTPADSSDWSTSASNKLNNWFDGNSTTKTEPNGVTGNLANSVDFTGVSGLQNFSGVLKFAVSAYLPTSGVSFIVNEATDNFVVESTTLPPSTGKPTSTVTIPVTSLQTVKVNNVSGSSIQFWAAYLDDKELVDSSIPGGAGATDITKTEAYSTKLTVASDKDLGVITGDIYMTDGTVKQDGSGELEPASYTPQTSTIASVTQTKITKEWSDKTTCAKGFEGSNTPENLFDGNPSTLCQATNQTEVIVDTSGTGLYAKSTVRFKVSAAALIHLLINGINVGTAIQANTWNEVDFNGKINSLSVESPSGSAAGVYWYAVEVDGQELINSSAGGSFTGESLVLTFATPNPDLQYFEVGDVVVKGDGWDETIVWEGVRTGDKAFNGDISSTANSCLPVASSLGGLSVNSWRSTIPITGSVKLYYWNQATNTSTQRIVVNGSQISLSNHPDNIQSVDITAEAGNSITKIDIYRSIGSGGAIAIAGIEVDGSLVLRPAGSGYKITATDLTANTMTVDGGSWLGADGSGDAGDNRYEPSQEWSAFLTGAQQAVKAFDGNLTTHASAGTVADIFGFTTSFENVSSMRVKFRSDGDIPQHSISISGNGFDTLEAQGTLGNSQSDKWQTITVTSSNVSGITIAGSSTTGASLCALEINNTILVDSSIPGGAGDTDITGSTESAEGTIASVDGTEVDLSASTGRWIANNKAGTAFSFVPSIPVVDTKNEAYGKLQIVGDQAMVTGIQADDPGFTNTTSKNYSITFPAAFATGNTPDDDLPMGTSISTIVRAKNSEGESIKGSNVLLPSLPNPEGSAGPITGATPTELTVGTSANLDGFIADDALVMVDDTGAVASYTPVTSTIASVGVINAWNQSETWSNGVSGDIDGNYGNALHAFNGDLSTKPITGGANMLVPAPNKTVTIAFTGLTDVSVLGIWCASSDRIENVFINGTNISTQLTAARSASGLAKNQSGWSYINMPNGPAELTEFRFYRSNDSQNGIYLSGLSVDGIILVDNGISGDPGAGNLLTFTSPNADLKFFNPGEVLGAATGFKPVTYTGTTGILEVTGVGFKPSLVWIKQRNGTGQHALFKGAEQYLVSNSTDQQRSNGNTLQSFTDDGFTLGTEGFVNGSASNTYVAWCWEASDTTVTNNEGTIESQVRSNGNFSVIKYTGNGSATAQIGHGLSNAPSMFVVKSTSDRFPWFVYHESIGAANTLQLNENNEANPTQYWQNTDPSSSVIYLDGAVNNEVAGDGKAFIAYAWAETPGVSSFGEYSGNGSTTGPVIDCGFEPAFVMIKTVNVADSWRMFDTARSPSNPANKLLMAEASQAELERSEYDIDVLPNGFQLKNARNGLNFSGETYIYAAFAAGGNDGTVVSTNLAANQMVVDGGSYLGADASGNAGGKTEVTGPEKSGVATFVSTNGTDTMFVDNSNDEWISNDNRLGKEFFIKKIFTALNANDPAHVEMQKAVNEAFEAFPKNVQARKTQIAKTFTKLVAGAAITKAELNALRVVVEAAAEDD